MIETARTKIVLIAVLAQALPSARALAKDWPQYKGDPARSGVATDALAPPLVCRWVYQPPQPPRPAWEEPGKEAHRLDFDFSPQPVIADGRVFFCGSSDDTVRALELASGKLLWRFTTGGPTRFAPAIAHNRVFVASDDGHVYCLSTAKGELIWRFRAAPADDLLLGNGRMISRWPARCGVVAVDGLVYTVAGMWPTEGVYVYALDAKTGKVVWRNDSTGVQYVELPHPGATGFSGVAPQGYLAVSGDVLLVPTGRSCPAAFDRKTGAFLYCWPHRSWNDAKRGGCWLTTAGGLYYNPTREPTGTTESFVGEAPPLPGDGMVAYDVKTNKPLFELKGRHRVLVAGDVLYGVGNGQAAAYDLAALRAGKGPDKAVKWTAEHLRVYSLALAGKTLYIGGMSRVTALNTQTGKREWYQLREIPGAVRGLAVGAGRLVASTDQGVVAGFGPPGAWPRRIDGSPDWRIAIPAEVTTLADDVIRRARRQTGCALVLGEDDSTLAAALAMRSRLHVIHAVRGEDRAAAERRKLMHTDLYGSRVAVVAVTDLGRLPFAPYFADLIFVSGKDTHASGKALYRVLRPCGGVMLFDAKLDSKRIISETDAAAKEITKDADGRPMIVRGPLPGAGEWRHQWADGGRSGIGQERRLTMPLGLLWFGGPGPNRMMDRHFGSSPPLSVSGRVFVTGEHHLIAFDAYNGRELWARPMRGLGRRGVMRRAANIVADDDAIYVVIGSACYRIAQASGEIMTTYGVPEAVSREPAAWDYVGLAGDLVLGNCPATSGLFALDKRTGALRWHWRAKHRLPSTAIAFSESQLYCLDVEPPDTKAWRRGVVKKPSRDLVALGLTSGTEMWRQKGVPQTPSDSVQFAKDTIVVGGSVAYDAAAGKRLWQKATNPDRPPLIRGDWLIAQPHAFHLRTGEQRMATDTTTGERRPWRYIQSYGCGGVAGCQSMLFFRSAAAGFYDFQSDGTTTFGGVRVGCSINMIAANGLAIMPETSSGCPCSYNFQTSLALVPSGDGTPNRWFVFEGQRSAEPLSRANLNLGAPGDRLEADGARWLGMPRPILGGAAPVRLAVSSKDARYYRHPRQDELAGMDKPWLYGSGVRNPGRVTVDLVDTKAVVAFACEKPLVIDGKLDPSLRDADAKQRMQLGFSNGLKRKAFVYVRYDDANLYFVVQCHAEPPKPPKAPQPVKPAGQGKAAKPPEQAQAPSKTQPAKPPKPPWVKTCKGQDARVWEDDSWEFYISDRKGRACVHLGVSASGARFDGVWDCETYDAVRGLNRAWNGNWKSAVSTDLRTMTVEVAVPFAVLKQAGLNREELRLNLLGTGPGALGSPDFLSVQPDGFSGRWRGFIEPTATETVTLTVRADQYALLRIGEKIVINHDGKGKPTETSVKVPMKAGVRVPIEMIYEEVKGPAVAQLFWSSPSTPKSIVPATALRTADGKPGGLSAAYGNRWYEDPVLERIDPAIDFEWKHEDLRKVPKSELRYHGSQRPQRGQTFLPVSFGPSKVGKTYAVRLHFAEVEDVKPGQRVFDVKIQGRSVADGFDVVREAKGRNRPIVKTFPGVSLGDRTTVDIELIPRGGPTSSNAAPILCGIEIVAE